MRGVQLVPPSIQLVSSSPGGSDHRADVEPTAQQAPGWVTALQQQHDAQLSPVTQSPSTMSTSLASLPGVIFGPVSCEGRAQKRRRPCGTHSPETNSAGASYGAVGAASEWDTFGAAFGSGKHHSPLNANEDMGAGVKIEVAPSVQMLGPNEGSGFGGWGRQAV